MNGVNLMPMHRRQTQRRLGRVRLWTTIAVVVSIGAVVAEGALWSAWRGSGTDLAAESDRLASQIADGEKQVAAGKASVREIRKQLEADRQVADQPDWGLLLSLVAEKLGPEAALNQCRLEAPKDAIKEVPSARGKGADRAKQSRLILVLSGIAKTQDAASQVALALKGLNLFDAVSLIEARRATFMGKDAVTFRIECAITDAGAATAKAGEAGGEP